MKKLTKKRKILILTPLIIILILIIAIIVYPIIGPNWYIRMRILMQIPIGTSMEDAIEIAQNNSRWEKSFVSYNNGVRLKGIHQSPNITSFANNVNPVIGEHAMSVYLGEYRFVFVGGVTAFFAFCEDEKLIDVFIRKDWDTL
ncbi:MAG: hypothetical protein LBC86_07180 [Oscillospiraceae bacterium]|jgi:hypothetical protein|nr:hypothetical protein [Oscillospiraceae bacterium]